MSELTVELLINQLFSSIATIPVMLLLPLIWWLVTARKAQNFFLWIGLKRIQTEKKTTLLLWFFGAAAAFRLMHGVMFFTAVGALRATLVTILTGTIGWGLGGLNEKQAGVSIFPSWAIHVLSNLIAEMCAALTV